VSSSPHSGFVSQQVRKHGYCGEQSPDGQWVCVKDMDHDGPHGDERWDQEDERALNNELPPREPSSHSKLQQWMNVWAPKEHRHTLEELLEQLEAVQAAIADARVMLNDDYSALQIVEQLERISNPAKTFPVVMDNTASG